VPRDTRARTEAAAPQPASPAASTARPTKIITEPVRSGQQIYAEGSDLVVLSTISTGAEVIADGCIHAYGALRGRALAGASGETTARIFARRFEAELVAVAGLYALADQLKGVATGNAAQVLLQQGKLVIEALA
jgi:septum site-determining protein MinC